MKLISCIIRPERLAAVKEALFQAGVTGISIYRLSGHGGEQEVVEHYRGSSIVLEFKELEQVVRIRTGERDNAALTPVTADAVQRRARAVTPLVAAR